MVSNVTRSPGRIPACITSSYERAPMSTRMALTSFPCRSPSSRPGILHSSRVVMRTGCSWRAAMRTLPTGSTSIAPSREMLRTINPTSSICAQIITFGPVDSLRRISTDPSPSNRTSFCRRSASSSRICRTSCSEEAIASASLNAFNSDKSIMPLP